MNEILYLDTFLFCENITKLLFSKDIEILNFNKEVKGDHLIFKITTKCSCKKIGCTQEENDLTFITPRLEQDVIDKVKLN